GTRLGKPTEHHQYEHQAEALVGTARRDLTSCYHPPDAPPPPNEPPPPLKLLPPLDQPPPEDEEPPLLTVNGPIFADLPALNAFAARSRTARTRGCSGTPK